MRTGDLLSVAIRQSRLRLVESFLIVLGIALGAAVVAAFAGLIASAGAQVRSFAESPMAWEMSIVPREQDYMALWQTTGGFVPAVPVGPAGAPAARLTMRDLERVKSAVTSARHVYTYQYTGLPLRPPETPVSSSEPAAQKDGVPAAAAMPAKGDGAGEHERASQEPASTAQSLLQQRGMVQIIATIPEYFEAYGLKLREGSFFLDSDVSSGSKVIVLGAKLATRLFGDASPVGQELMTDSARLSGQATPVGKGVSAYKVIGVLEPASGASAEGSDARPAMAGPLDYLDDMGFVPLTSMPGYAGPDAQIQSVYVMPPSGDESATTLDELRRLAEREYQGRVTVRSEIDEMKRAVREMRSQAVGVVLLASAGLVIASINILNLMLARVLRRTKAIGISVALGASRRDVFAQLLVESFVLGLAGGLVGIAFAYAVTSLMSRVTQGLAVTLGIWGILAGVGASLIASVVFGVYPAHLAARTIAVDALRRD